MAALIFLAYVLLLTFTNLVQSEVLLDISNGDTSDWILMTCDSSYCANTTIFTFNQENECHNPLLTVHFRLTDFENAELQYLTITLNGQQLGQCTGPNEGSYNTSHTPLYTDCLNALSVAELVGYNPTSIKLGLRISPHVANGAKAYQSHLLYALVAFGCSDKDSNKETSQDWDPASPIAAHSNLQCIQSGCYAIARFTVLSPEECRVPLLSLQFWLTDFDQAYEYMTIEVNNAYLGICQGGKQMEINTNLVSIEEEDAYWNNYSVWCFREVDISRYTGVEPGEIVVRLSIQDTVDNNWLDVSPTPYLLDAIINIECGTRTQDDTVANPMIYNRKTTSSNYPYAHEVSIKCQEVECGAMWNWHILGQCPYPVLSLFYFTQHYDDAMIELKINEKLLGHCGPTLDSGNNESLSTQYGMKNVRTCFEEIELIELLGDSWNSRPDFDGNTDAIFNEFQFGFALTEIDELDGIQNGSVAHLFINLDCVSKSAIKNNEIVSISDETRNAKGFPFGTTHLNCVYAGCFTSAVFVLDLDFMECEIPSLDLAFYLTDFGEENEFISIGINEHLYGWCDGGKDHRLGTMYRCLHDADIQEWTDWDLNGNQLQLTLNASSYVNGLDATKDGYLINAIATLTCYTNEADTKWKEADIYPMDAALKQQKVHVLCQGVGCFTYAIFHIKDNTCYQPTLSVAFWLSDFSTFDEYVTVDINNKQLQKCYGGADQELDEIWVCFESQDIRYTLTNYAYNDGANIEEYYIDADGSLNVSLTVSSNALWLDHSKNYSILQGSITLNCEANNIPLNTTSHAQDIDDLDRDAFRFVELTLVVQKVKADLMLSYHEEIQSRFEYSLHASIHFEDERTANRDHIAFTMQSEVNVVESGSWSELKLYITTFNAQDAIEIKRVVELDLFLFILQETLRDSHFSTSILEAIRNVQIISALPQIQPTVVPTKRPQVENTAEETKEDTPQYIAPKSNENMLKVLFTSASATDWLSFLGVLVLFMCVCMCCVGIIASLCIYQQRQKTRKEIKTYKQTKESTSSDSDSDEIQAMMHDFNGKKDEEASILSQHSYSIKSFLSNKSVVENDAISDKIRTANRANHLKDNIKRHQSHTDKSKHHKTKKQYSKYTSNDDRRSSESYCNSANLLLASHSDRNQIELCASGISGDLSAKSIAIHPALSTAIQTVHQMKGLKSEIAANHQLVVSSTIMEADSEESESTQSGIDLSEEYITIADDIDVSIDIEDIEDMNDIKKKHKRTKSRNEKFKNHKYSSIEDEEDEDKVFGMRTVAEDEEEDKFSINAQNIKKSSDEDSDALSDLSDDISLNSLTQSFSQMI